MFYTAEQHERRRLATCTLLPLIWGWSVRRRFKAYKAAAILIQAVVRRRIAKRLRSYLADWPPLPTPSIPIPPVLDPGSTSLALRRYTAVILLPLQGSMDWEQRWERRLAAVITLQAVARGRLAMAEFKRLRWDAACVTVAVALQTLTR